MAPRRESHLRRDCVRVGVKVRLKVRVRVGPQTQLTVTAKASVSLAEGGGTGQDKGQTAGQREGEDTCTTQRGGSVEREGRGGRVSGQACSGVSGRGVRRR